MYCVFASKRIELRVSHTKESFPTFEDCYVAVTGLPQPRKDHAIIMTYFAQNCLATMEQIKRKLAITLGPDTADLAIRVGLNSGPGKEDGASFALLLSDTLYSHAVMVLRFRMMFNNSHGRCSSRRQG